MPDAENDEMLTEEELNQPATRRDLRSLEATLGTRIDEVRRHFDIVAAEFKSEFKNLHDWTKVTTDSLGERLDSLEKDHEGRLLKVETRLLVADLAAKTKKKPASRQK